MTTTVAPTSTTSPEDTAAGTTETTDPGEDARPPVIHEVDLPLKVMAAGPVHVAVLAEATAVRGWLDGSETFLFKHDGDEDGDGIAAFSAEIPFFGYEDNGLHELEVVAERDNLFDHRTRWFEGAAPVPGVVAWDEFGGPGTRTTRLAVDPAEGFVFEGGGFEIGGIERPAVRKRDPVTGADMFPGGWTTLDNRQGYVADLAVAPEGRLWVAMNVKENNIWRARLALLEPDLLPTGIELEKPNVTVTAIDSDGEGGCFGGGFASTPFGDVDVMMFRIAGDGTPIASGHPWDYLSPTEPPQTFLDVAFDVVADPQAGEVWIVGMSQGKHIPMKPDIMTRGMIVRVDLDTLEVLDPVIIAPELGNMTDSTFYGGALDPNGILVVGTECTMKCATQRVAAYRYGPGGGGTVVYSGKTVAVARGSGIARNTHGTILIAASVKDGPTLRGSLLGLRDGMETFGPLAFPGVGASSADDVKVGPYDWAFGAGYVTTNGVQQAYLVRPHQ